VPFPLCIVVVPILMICSHHSHHLFCNDGYGAKDLVVVLQAKESMVDSGY
jgi:hypothetical protein